MSETIFNYSPQLIKKIIKKSVIMISIACLFGLGYFLLIAEKEQLKPEILIPGLAVTILMAIISFYFISKIVTKIVLKIKISLDSEKLQFRNTIIRLPDVTSIKVKKLNDESLSKITVRSKNRVIFLAGLENMQDCLNLLQKYITDTSIFSIKE